MTSPLATFCPFSTAEATLLPPPESTSSSRIIYPVVWLLVPAVTIMARLVCTALEEDRMRYTPM